MAQMPKGRSVKGQYKPICRDCAMYFLIIVRGMLITKKVEANGCSPKQFSLFKGKHHIRTYQVR